MRGIDVSNNNAGELVLADVGFVLAKVTEGTNFVDDHFASYAEQCDAGGVPYGGYHFAHPDTNRAADEANWFLEHYRPAGTVQPALDIEPRGTGAQHRDPLAIMGPGPLAQWCDAWCGIVLEATGLEPLQYMDRDYCSHLAPYSQRWPLWLATLDTTVPPVYAGRTVAVVQYETVSGVDQDFAYTLNIKGDFMGLTDEEQTELLAIVRAMGTQNWQAPSMSLQWLDDHVKAQIDAAIPAIADAVAAKAPAGGVSGAVEVSGTVELTEPAAGPPAATEPASEATTATPAPAPAVEPTPPAEPAATPPAGEPTAG